MKKINKLNKISEATTDALSSYNLLKHPFENKAEVPAKTDIGTKNDSSNFASVLFIGAIDFENRDNSKDIEQVIFLIDTEETSTNFDIN